MTTLKQAQKRIDAIRKEIDKLVDEAQDLCDETGASFRLNFAYGMGGNYMPRLTKAGDWSEEARNDHDVVMEDGEWSYDGYSQAEPGDWHTSSMSC